MNKTNSDSCKKDAAVHAGAGMLFVFLLVFVTILLGGCSEAKSNSNQQSTNKYERKSIYSLSSAAETTTSKSANKETEIGDAENGSIEDSVADVQYISGEEFSLQNEFNVTDSDGVIPIENVGGNKVTIFFLTSIVSDYSTIEFLYDDNNELIQTVETTQYGDTFTTDYSYNEANKCVMSRCWSDSMEGSGYTTNEWFFNDNYEIEKLRTVDSSDEISYTYYTYNSQGWVIHAKHEAALEDWCWEQDYSYEYDANRNPVSSSGFGTEDVFENGRLISSTGVNGTHCYNYEEMSIDIDNVPRWAYTSILLLSRY